MKGQALIFKDSFKLVDFDISNDLIWQRYVVDLGVRERSWDFR